MCSILPKVMRWTKTGLYNITDSEFADWSYEDVPPQEIGKLYLTQNPWAGDSWAPHATALISHCSQNYFAEIEQLGFSPSHMVCPSHPLDMSFLETKLISLPPQVEGVEPSEDPVLQARLFAYPGMLQSASRESIVTNSVFPDRRSTVPTRCQLSDNPGTQRRPPFENFWNSHPLHYSG